MDECKACAWEWTMLVTTSGRKRMTIAWPSLCEDEEDAKAEAESVFNCSVFEVRGKTPLYYGHQVLEGKVTSDG